MVTNDLSAADLVHVFARPKKTHEPMNKSLLSVVVVFVVVVVLVVVVVVEVVVVFVVVVVVVVVVVESVKNKIVWLVNQTIS